MGLLIRRALSRGRNAHCDPQRFESYYAGSVLRHRPSPLI